MASSEESAKAITDCSDVSFDIKYDVDNIFHVRAKFSELEKIFANIKTMFQVSDAVSALIEECETKRTVRAFESCFGALVEIEGFKQSQVFRNFVFETSLIAGRTTELVNVRLSVLESILQEQRVALINTNKALVASIMIIEELAKKAFDPGASANISEATSIIASNLDVIRSTELLKASKSHDRRDSARNSIYSVSSINESISSEPTEPTLRENGLSNEDTGGEERDSEYTYSTSLRGVWSIPVPSTIDEVPPEYAEYISPHDFKQSELLPYDLIPKNIEPSPCDTAIEEVISLIRPNLAQLHFRKNVKEFCSKVIRNTLGAHVFESGYSSLRCFLPDDPIKACTFPNKSCEINWGPILSDKLIRLASGVEDSIFYTGDDIQEPDIDYDDCVTKAITDVNHSQINGHGRVHFTVESILVEISGNDHSDLCFIGLLDEIGKLVGKSHLFKRSLLLIRAWWIYETPSYIGSTNPRSIISDEAFAILICAIFNQYHKMIQSPLQALVVFLAEYSALNWSKFAVSIHGAISLPEIQQEKGSSISLVDAMNSPSQLLGPSVLKTHRSFYCAGEAVERLNLSVLKLTTKSLERSPEKERSSLRSQGPEKFPESFPVTLMNIISPFCPTINMASPSVSSKKLHQFTRVFEIGAKNFCSFINLSREGDVRPQTLAQNAFPNIFRRFGSGWKPDISMKAKNTLGDSSLDLFACDTSHIWDGISYSNILVEGNITEAGFRMLFEEFLHEKGALPVGELGKMLQETTGNSTLSTALKMKFGGLKKFLEKYPNDFVIGVNHPFNPHVFLKQTLLEDEMDVIARGEIPRSVLLKFKKSRKDQSSKVKKTPSSSPSPEHPNTSSAPMAVRRNSRTATPPLFGGAKQYNGGAAYPPSTFPAAYQIASPQFKLEHSQHSAINSTSAVAKVGMIRRQSEPITAFPGKDNVLIDEPRHISDGSISHKDIVGFGFDDPYGFNFDSLSSEWARPLSMQEDNDNSSKFLEKILSKLDE